MPPKLKNLSNILGNSDQINLGKIDTGNLPKFRVDLNQPNIKPSNINPVDINSKLLRDLEGSFKVDPLKSGRRSNSNVNLNKDINVRSSVSDNVDVDLDIVNPLKTSELKTKKLKNKLKKKENLDNLIENRSKIESSVKGNVKRTNLDDEDWFDKMADGAEKIDAVLMVGLGVGTLVFGIYSILMTGRWGASFYGATPDGEQNEKKEFLGCMSNPFNSHEKCLKVCKKIHGYKHAVFLFKENFPTCHETDSDYNIIYGTNTKDDNGVLIECVYSNEKWIRYYDRLNDTEKDKAIKDNTICNKYFGKDGDNSKANLDQSEYRRVLEGFSNDQEKNDKFKEIIKKVSIKFLNQLADLTEEKGSDNITDNDIDDLIKKNVAEYENKIKNKEDMKEIFGFYPDIFSSPLSFVKQLNFSEEVFKRIVKLRKIYDKLSEDKKLEVDKLDERNKIIYLTKLYKKRRKIKKKKKKKNNINIGLIIGIILGAIIILFLLFLFIKSR